MQSQSLAGSVMATYNLRNLNIISLAILLVWTLSPLGGQSSLRVLSNSKAVVQSQVTIYGATAETIQYFGGSSSEVTTSSVINALFSASLLAPDNIRTGPVDSWGNYKIPAVKYISNLDSDTWYTTDPNSQSMNYSSLVGVPTWGLPKQGTVNFTVTWPIFYTDCSWDRPGYTALEWCLNISLSECTTTNNVCLQGNESCVLNQTTGQVAGPFYYGPGIFRSDTWDGMNASDPASVNVTQLKSNSPPQYVDITYSTVNTSEINNITYVGLKAQCKLRTTRVEAEVFCTDASCGVSRFRKSNDSRPDFINPVSIAGFHDPSLCKYLLTRYHLLALRTILLCNPQI